jgi:putative zinc finger protein
MAKKSMHPETELFEYLNHSLGEERSTAVETHLSTCEECASVAALVRTLKGDRSLANQPTRIENLQNHPAINELASFFYSQEELPNRAHVASHIALCDSCAEAIAQYARAEQASESYAPSATTAGEVSAEAWKMIYDWENSSFGNLKPANEVLGQQLLDRLSQLFKEQPNRETGAGSSQAKPSERIPVLVVSSSGEVRGVEFFDQEIDHSGLSVLRHSEGSERFDNRPVHALFALDEKGPVLVSTVMNRDTVRIEQTRLGGEARRADYFIIED